ncbi:SURF1 family protein [Chthonobacter rhizosphaerae]|uniref:SURF1 family protein n=1 Tax=Chthonobacter rhizosphaerae TaxID=2735553 RepID=UPI0015EE8F90|nr:SURF1 family protein [Chthonobacter rhizosphaerae]
MSTHPHAPGAAAPRRSLVWLTVATAAALAVLIALGTWQVERLHWKQALIARVEERLASPPQPLPAPETWADLTAEEVEYRPVSFTGRYDHSREIHVFIALTQPKGPLRGQGYFVMTPAMLADGRWVFVNRGFVPLDRKDASTRPESQIPGDVTIAGLMRPAEEPSWLSPKPDVSRNVWFVRDPARMAVAAGLDPARVAPFTVDAFAADLPGGLPQGGETVITFSNNHLQYVVTWYGLAAALAVVYVALARKLLRRG